jgi:hypothetical protein
MPVPLEYPRYPRPPSLESREFVSLGLLRLQALETLLLPPLSPA